MPASILVVDDNRDSLDILCSMLGAQGYVAIPADSGKKALRILETQSVDAVVLDILMPEMDGLTVLDHIRQSPGGAKLPVIMCSAKGDASDILVGYERGADYYLTKPCGQKQLLFGVALALGRSGLPGSTPGDSSNGPLVM